MFHRWARWVVALGTAGSFACGAPPRAASSALAGSPRAAVTTLERAPTEPVVARSETPEPISYDDTLARELPLPSLASRDLAASERLHFVLDAGRCYRLVMVAEGSVSAALHDARGAILATGTGRIVRLSGICPRWTGSFELGLELVGARGRVALYPDDDAEVR